MAVRRSGMGRAYGGRPRVQRRKTMWSTTNVTAGTIATLQSTVPLDLAADLVAAGVGVLGGTVIRTHLRLSCSHPIADTNPGVFYGIIVYDKAHAAAAVPDVSVDFNDDWMYENILSPGTSLGPVNTSTSFLYGETLDLKARRRLHEINDRPFFILHNNGSTTLTYALFVKQLYALP